MEAGTWSLEGSDLQKIRFYGSKKLPGLGLRTVRTLTSAQAIYLHSLVMAFISHRTLISRSQSSRMPSLLSFWFPITKYICLYFYWLKLSPFLLNLPIPSCSQHLFGRLSLLISSLSLPESKFIQCIDEGFFCSLLLQISQSDASIYQTFYVAWDMRSNILESRCTPLSLLL